MTRRYEEALRPAGVSVSQYELMVTLKTAKAVDQKTLGSLLEMDQTTLSRNVGLLVRMGWIETAPDARDGRRKSYRLTVASEVILAKAMICWNGVHQEITDAMGASMWDVWPVLDKIRDVARNDAT